MAPDADVVISDELTTTTQVLAQSLEVPGPQLEADVLPGGLCVFRGFWCGSPPILNLKKGGLPLSSSRAILLPPQNRAIH